MTNERRSEVRPAKLFGDVCCAVATAVFLFTFWRNARDEHVSLVAFSAVVLVVFWGTYFFTRYRPIKSAIDQRSDSD